MPVPPTPLALLASLDAPRRLADLARANARPLSTVRHAVGSLADRGLVRTHKEEGEIVVACTSTALPTLAGSLIVDHPRRDWGSVFHGDRPTVLHVLDRVGRPDLCADVCDKTRRAVYHAIERHGPQGILVKQASAYRINPRLSDLKELLAEMARATAHHEVGRVAPDARLLWHLGPELLLRSTEAPSGPNVHRGALSRFHAHDVPLMTGARTYHYVATRPLDAADAILQTLLVDPESRINRSYAALLYEKTRPDNLGRKAHIYGLEDEVDRLVRYVDDQVEVDGFLPWREHRRYRRQYGVGP